MVPPWTSTKLLAMASPSPEPSVLRDVSPRTNRSVSSSGDTSSSLAEILRMVISTWPSSSLTTWIYQQVSKYTVGLLAVQIKKDFLLRQIVAELDPACLNLIRQLKPHLL